MPQNAQLKLSAIVFAVLWTIGMLIFARPLDLPTLVIMPVCGVLVGLLWYWLFGLWFRWWFKQPG